MRADERGLDGRSYRRQHWTFDCNDDQVPGSKNLFKIFSGSHKVLAGMGCKARCAVDSPAIHKRRNAADRPARRLPEGLE